MESKKRLLRAQQTTIQLSQVLRTCDLLWTLGLCPYNTVTLCSETVTLPYRTDGLPRHKPLLLQGLFLCQR